MGFLKKIPIIRALIAELEKRAFAEEWRRRNPHNETKVSTRAFPMDILTVGRGTYGTIIIQSLYETDREKVTIGNYVSIAPNVTFLVGVNHQITTATTFPFYSKLVHRSPVDAISNGPIVVNDEVWIGTGAYIFSGVTIGKGAIIGAGALVTKDVPPYAIVGGNPARIIRFRFSEEIIKILLPIRFANFSDDWIRKNIGMIYKKIETIDDAIKLKALVDSCSSKSQ